MRRRRARPRIAALALGGLVLALTVLGQGTVAAQTEAPRFVVEKITIDSERLSSEIVLSESLLREGEEYTENQLREAVHRIHRLPFVLRAEFSLRKGSEKGRYELVIEVFETRRWFFRVDGNWTLNDVVDELDPRFGGELRDRIGDTTDDADALVGRRFALGPRSLLFASLGTDDGTFAIGFQRYNLFNRNVLLSLSLAGEDRVGSVITSTNTRTARLQLGIPIRGNHALRVLSRWSRDDRTFLFGFRERLDIDEYEAEVAWVFNSQDDPVLPREGSVYETGLTWWEREGVDFFFSEGEFVPFSFSEERLGLIAAASRHWPVAERQSFSAGGRAYFGEDGDSSSIWEAEASVGHQIFLLRNLEPDKWRELRLETEAAVLRQDIGDFERPEVVVERPELESWRVRTGLAYRNSWGLFRLFLEYGERELR